MNTKLKGVASGFSTLLVFISLYVAPQGPTGLLAVSLLSSYPCMSLPNDNSTLGLS